MKIVFAGLSHDEFYGVAQRTVDLTATQDVSWLHIHFQMPPEAWETLVARQSDIPSKNYLNDVKRRNNFKSFKLQAVPAANLTGQRQVHITEVDDLVNSLAIGGMVAFQQNAALTVRHDDFARNFTAKDIKIVGSHAGWQAWQGEVLQEHNRQQQDKSLEYLY